MSIKDNRITQAEIEAVMIENAPDSMIGMSAHDVKRRFDSYPNMLADKINTAYDSLRELESSAMSAIAEGDAATLKAAKDCISDIMIEVGAGDMVRKVYDSDWDGVVNAADKAAVADLATEALLAKRAESSDFAAAASGELEETITAIQAVILGKADKAEGVVTLTHAFVNGAHSLTGLLPTVGFVSVRFKAAANMEEGTTFRINNVAYQVKDSLGEVPDGLFAVGAVVTCELDIGAKTINFKAGGTSAPKEFGDGSDGHLVIKAGEAVTLPVINNGILIKQYKSINIAPGGVLTTSAPNVGLILKCRGDCNIDGVIDQSGKGYYEGVSNYPYISGLSCGNGGKGGSGGKGAGTGYCESIVAYGGSGLTGYTGKIFTGGRAGWGGGGGGGVATSNYELPVKTPPTGGNGKIGGKGGYDIKNAKACYGGNGGNGTGSTYGGGIIYLHCGGRLTISGSLDASGGMGATGGKGDAGSGATSGYGGGGGGAGGDGGGGGGAIYICYNDYYLNTGVMNVNGGNGGDGGEGGATSGFQTPSFKGSTGAAGTIGSFKAEKFER